MGAAFGDLLAVADAHWAEAMEWLELPESSWQVRDRSTSDELEQAALVLARYAERVGTGFSARGRDDEVARDARLCAASLRNVASAFRKGGEESGERCELARSLFMARQALGCGLDLLSAHFEVGEGGLRPITGQSALISSSSSAKWLLTVVGGYADHLLLVAERAGQADAVAGLREAVGHAKGEQAQADPRLRITTMPEAAAASTVELTVGDELPERVPLVGGEGRERVFAGIQANARWLQSSGIPQSARTWRSLATSTLMTSEISGQILRLLMVRCRQLGLTEEMRALAEAETAVGELADKWTDVTVLWRAVVCDRRARLDQMMVDAGELVVRLGRLAYADRAWKPSANAVTRPVRPQVLAPEAVDVHRVALAVEDAIKVPHTVASRALDGLIAGRMTGLKSRGETQVKLRRERFGLHYLQARKAADEAQEALGKAIRSLTSSGGQSPGRLAAESFPFKAGDVLTGPKTTAPRNNRVEKGARLTWG